MKWGRIHALLRLAHADEAAVVLAGQGPEEGADVGAFVEEADCVDAHAGFSFGGPVLVGGEDLADELAQNLAALDLAEPRLLVGQPLALMRQSVGDKIG